MESITKKSKKNHKKGLESIQKSLFSILNEIKKFHDELDCKEMSLISPTDFTHSEAFISQKDSDQQGFISPQNSFSQPQNSFSQPQNSFSQPQGCFGEPFSQPQNSFSQSQGCFGEPFSQPKGCFGEPFSQSQGCFGETFSQPQGCFGEPFFQLDFSPKQRTIKPYSTKQYTPRYYYTRVGERIDLNSLKRINWATRFIYRNADYVIMEDRLSVWVNRCIRNGYHIRGFYRKLPL